MRDGDLITVARAFPTSVLVKRRIMKKCLQHLQPCKVLATDFGHLCGVAVLGV